MAGELSEGQDPSEKVGGTEESLWKKRTLGS